MVMGALGMIGAQAFSHPGAGRFKPMALRGAAAALLLFIFWGTTPGTDILAHAGGFVGGLVLGLLAEWSLREPSRRRNLNSRCVFLISALLLASWWLALRGR